MRFRLGDYLLDADRRELKLATDLVAVEPQVFDLPVYLVQNRKRVVSKDVQHFEEGRRMAAGIPGARFVPLEGRNHLMLEDEPAWARFLSEVRAFLRPMESLPSAVRG